MSRDSAILGADDLSSDDSSSSESSDATGDSAPCSPPPLADDPTLNSSVPIALPSAPSSPDGTVVLASPSSSAGIESAAPAALPQPLD